MNPDLIAEVKEIRSRYAELKSHSSGPKAREVLAEEFHCSVERIRQIVNSHKHPYETLYHEKGRVHKS